VHALPELSSTEELKRRAGYLSVRTAGGEADRRWLKARRINGLIPTYLFSLTTIVLYLSIMKSYKRYRQNVYTSVDVATRLNIVSNVLRSNENEPSCTNINSV